MLLLNNCDEHCTLFCTILFYSPLLYSILFCPILLCPPLFCPILFCPILFCPILFCPILFCPILFYSVLFYSILSYSILFCPILFCPILFYSVLFYSVLFYSIPSYILFCPILFYSVLFYTVVDSEWHKHSTLHLNPNKLFSPMQSKQSAVASVSSDGSVRCGFSSTMGTSKQGDRRRKGVEKWAMEIFRVENTTESEGSKVSDQMEIDDDALESEEDSWSGTVASIGVSLKRSLDIEYGMIRIATHSLALHSVVSTPLTLQDSRGTVMSHLKNTVLMAYGGASGLLRIHSIDLLEDIVGIGSH